jgi:hypothetical protein
VLGPEPDSYLVAEMARQRDRLRPEDMLAVAFNGMARQHIRGSFAGEDLEKLASNLRRLADALDAFHNYPPGAFFDTATLRDLAARDEPATGDQDSR